ncbi:anti-sigma factor [Cellulomonas sp. McL0617]|uniref:anti-sigma factor n=1 Tax=Cellulomonas sp. McL0617 TaxID=3415675 RepID=UPI003CE872E4
MDDETLALIALGEPAGSAGATAADRAHAERCARCSGEVAALREVVALGREAEPMLAPAPRVWERISAELALGAAPTRAEAAPPGRAEARGDAEPVVDLAGRRRPRQWRWTAAAAAVGVLLGGSAVWWQANRHQPHDVVATATLQPLPGWNDSGSAFVETSRDGARTLVVDLSHSESSAGGFREVWLLKPDVSGLVSVGTLDGSTGRFDLPPGLDLSTYSVVDVSEEPFDGNPAHSGNSIVRGALKA